MFFLNSIIILQEWGSYDSKVDIYSLGLILVELCVHLTSEQAYEVRSNLYFIFPTNFFVLLLKLIP